MATYQFQPLLLSLQRALPGVLHLAVIERSTAKPVSVLNCELEVHGRLLAEVRKATRKAEATLRMHPGEVREIIVTLTDRVQLIAPMHDGRYLIYAAANAHSVSPAQLIDAVRSQLKAKAA